MHLLLKRLEVVKDFLARGDLRDGLACLAVIRLDVVVKLFLKLFDLHFVLQLDLFLFVLVDLLFLLDGKADLLLYCGVDLADDRLQP